MRNIDIKTVADFGKQWANFDQSQLNDESLAACFNQYFSIFPWSSLPDNAVGFDLGCGNGRWAKFMAPKIGKLFCVDASEKALEVAKQNLQNNPNVECIHASVDDLPFAANSMDFGYSLGVLHHIPNTVEGMIACVEKIKPGSPFLVYLYYAFDNRSWWFRLLWKLSDFFRQIICPLPFGIKKIITYLIALFIYFPLARIAAILERLGFGVNSFPLSFYRYQKFYFMQIDALDRFGTRIEKRFTKEQINQMMSDSGLENIIFSNSVPYWCAVGVKKPD